MTDDEIREMRAWVANWIGVGRGPNTAEARVERLCDALEEARALLREGEVLFVETQTRPRARDWLRRVYELLS